MEFSTCSFLVSHPRTTMLAPIETNQYPEYRFNRLCIDLINKVFSPESPQFPPLSNRKALIKEDGNKALIKEDGNSIHQMTTPNQSNPLLHSENRDDEREKHPPLFKPELKLQTKLNRFCKKKQIKKSTIKNKKFTPDEKRFIGTVLQYMIMDINNADFDRVDYLKNKIDVYHIPKITLSRQLARNLSRWKKEEDQIRLKDTEQALELLRADKQPNWKKFIMLIDRRRDRSTISLYDIQNIKDNLVGNP